MTERPPESPASLEDKLEAKKASIERKVGATLRAKIKLLEDKRDDLKRELEELKREYSEGGEVLEQLKSKSADLQKTFDTYKDVLRGEGIENKAEMIKNPAFSGDDKILEYKEAGRKVRGKVKEIKAVKSKLKEKVPDLVFRGGKKEGEAKSPREKAYEKIEAEIAKINQEIEALEAQTPERIEKERKIAECIEGFNGHQPYIGVNDLNPEVLAQSYLDMTIQIKALIKKYGAEVFREAVLRSLEPRIDRVFEDQYNSRDNRGRYDKKSVISRSMEILGKRLDLMLTLGEIEEMDREQNAKAIYEKEHQRQMEVNSAPSQIEKISYAREELKSKMSEKVTVLIDYQSSLGQVERGSGHGVFHDGKFAMGLKACYETPVLSQVTLETKDKIRVKKNWLFGLEQKFSKRKRPRFFGKEEFDTETLIAQREIDKEKGEIKNLENSVRAFENIDTTRNDQGIDLLNQLMRSNTSFFSRSSGLIEKTMTVGELLDYIEKYWETVQKSKPDEKDIEILGRYIGLKEKQQKLDREVKHLARGY